MTFAIALLGRVGERSSICARGLASVRRKTHEPREASTWAARIPLLRNPATPSREAALALLGARNAEELFEAR